MVVFGLGKNLLFKSILGRCAVQLYIPSIWNVFIKFRWHDEKLTLAQQLRSHYLVLSGFYGEQSPTEIQDEHCQSFGQNWYLSGFPCFECLQWKLQMEIDWENAGMRKCECGVFQMPKNIVKSWVEDEWFVRNFGMSDLENHIPYFLI